MPPFLRRLAIAAAVLGLIAVGALAFASTETGFRTLIRPLLARWGVEVARGSVSLGGAIEAHEVRWSGGSMGQLSASLDPWSLLPGRRPHVLALEVVGLEVELAARGETEADPPDREEARADPPDSDEGVSLPALAIGSASVDLVALRQLDAQGERVWELGPAALSLEGWRPGEQGTLSIRSDFQLPAPDPSRTGTLAFESRVGVPAEADGALALEGALDVTLAPDDLVLEAEIRGEGALGGDLALSSPFELRRGEQVILEGVALDLAFGGDGLAVDLVVERAPAAALLASFGVDRPAARGIDLGLELEAGLAPASNQIRFETLRVVQRSPGAEPVEATLRGTITPGDAPAAELAFTGPGADGGEGSAELSLADGVADLRVASLDLTPLLGPWLDGDEEGAGDEAEEDGEPGGSDLTASFEIGALRFRELLVREARGTLRQTGERIEVEVLAARLGEGRLAGSFRSGLADGQRELAWKLDAEQLDLDELFRSLSGRGPGQLAGRLDLVSEASARVPEGSDPVEALEGTLELKLRDAAASDLPFQQYMASQLAVGGLASLAFTGAQGKFPIREGRALIDRFYIDGNAASFVVSGALSAEEVALAFNPRLGPRLASDLAPRFGQVLFETASGALALPLVFRMDGTWGERRFSMRPAPPSLVGDVLGVTGDVVSGAARFLFGGGEEEAPAPDSPAAPAGPAPEAEPDTEPGDA